MAANRPLQLAMIAGETSGDHLGAALITALKASRPTIETFGVGGPAMESVGFTSRFPMSEIAVMGPIAILKQVRRLRARILDAVEAIVTGRPDGLVIIDCPEFSHRVARRVRARLPDIPIIDYVAPQIWAWRPGRARRMRAYIDRVMAIMPFEPEVYQRLGGPRCDYVGHPAVDEPPPSGRVLERVAHKIAASGRPVLAVMPGSRRNEVSRLCRPFGEAVALLSASGDAPAVVVPALDHLADYVASETNGWAVRPVIVTDPAERRAAMVLADAAIVASGTATLELALARTPMVVGYRAEPLFAWMRRFLPIHSIVLANLIHGGNPIPELFQGACTSVRLAEAVSPLLRDGEDRRIQLEALDLIAAKAREGEEVSAAARAARIVLETVGGAPEPVADAPQRLSIGT